MRKFVIILLLKIPPQLKWFVTGLSHNDIRISYQASLTDRRFLLFRSTSINPLNHTFHISLKQARGVVMYTTLYLRIPPPFTSSN